MTKVIAFDLSTKQTGVAVWSTHELDRSAPPQTYVVKSKAKGWRDMALKLEDWVFNTAFLEHGDDFNYVLIEDAYMGRNPKTAMMLSTLHGFVISECYNTLFDGTTPLSHVMRVSTAKIDSACGLARGNRKAQTAQFATYMGCGDISQDEADAVALAYYGLTALNKETDS